MKLFIWFIKNKQYYKQACLDQGMKYYLMTDEETLKFLDINGAKWPFSYIAIIFNLSSSFNFIIKPHKSF